MYVYLQLDEKKAKAEGQQCHDLKLIRRPKKSGNPRNAWLVVEFSRRTEMRSLIFSALLALSSAEAFMQTPHFLRTAGTDICMHL